MFICYLCRKKSAPGEKRRLLTTYREVPRPGGGVRREIAREEPVCGRCESGVEDSPAGPAPVVRPLLIPYRPEAPAPRPSNSFVPVETRARKGGGRGKR